jgi:hypothetical protein
MVSNPREITPTQEVFVTLAVFMIKGLAGQQGGCFVEGVGSGGVPNPSAAAFSGE